MPGTVLVDSQSRRAWPVASRSCLIVISAAILLSLAGCSSGSSGGGNPPPPQNPAPAISSITPPTATAGAAGVTINVSGSGLVSTSAVAWNGASLATTLSGNQLSATIPLADLAAAGAVQITVVNPSPGGGTSNPLAFVIQGTQALPAPAFVYVGNSVGSISVFSVDPTTGSLTEVPGSPFQENVGAYSMTADPTGNFLYLGTVGGGTLQQAANDLFGFAIDSPTGVLTPVSGSPFPAEPGIENSIAIDPSGKFLYVAGLDYNSVDSISEFSINPTTGELTSISQVGCLGAPFGPEPAMYGPSYSVAVDPAEGFLLSLGQFNEVCTFSIGSSGVLQQVAGLPLVLDPNAILLNSAELAIDPSGKFGYTANGDFTISAFSIAPGSGALSELPGSPFTIQDPNAAGSVWIQMDPLDRFLWESDSSGNLTAYSINTSTGELTLLAGFPPSSSLGFASSTPLAVDPSGKFLYELNFSSGTSNQEVLISGYTIDESSGVLTAVSGSPFQLNLPANATPFTVTVSPKSQ